MLALIIIIIGAGGIIAQTILLRELLVSFFGNELTIGLILASWMLGEALGAFFIAGAARRVKDTSALLIAFLTVFAVSLFVSVICVRMFKPVFNIPIGQGIGTGMILISSFILMLLPSFCHGGLFSIICYQTRAWRGYMLETLGTLLGGIAVTWWAIPYFSHFEIIRATSLISVAACILRFRSVKGPWLKAILYPVVLVCLVGFLNIKPAQVEQYTLARQYRQGKVLDYRNSWYGNIVVTQKEGQRTFFYNGAPAVTTPLPDVIWSQDFGHLPLVFCKEARDILVVNAGLGGLVSEILKEPVKRVDYCQQDSLLKQMLYKYPSRLTQQELDDRRLNVIHADARVFLRDAGHTYDAVYIGSSMPGDLASNRFFTEEFFSIIRSRLDPAGVLALCLPGSLSYISPELRDMNYMIINAITRHFSRVRVIPGDYNIILASESAEFNVRPAVLSKRLSKRGVRASMLNPAYLKNRLAPQWVDWFRQSTIGATRMVNRDDKPSAVYQVLILWNKQFSAKTMALLQRMSGVRLWMILLAAALAGIITAVFARLRRRRAVQTTVLYAIATTGFFGMAMNLALIFRIQSQYGYVYQLIGALTALFMAGAAGGSILAAYATRSLLKPLRALAINETAAAVFPIIAFLCIMRTGPGFLLIPAYCALFLISGLIVGAGFPLAAGLYRTGTADQARAPGVVFSADLVGGVCAAVLAGVILLPLVGISAMLMGLAALKATAAINIILIKNMK